MAIPLSKTKIVVALGLVLALGVQLGSIDLPEVDDQGFLSQLSDLPDEDNAYLAIAYTSDPGFSLYGDRKDRQTLSNIIDGAPWNAALVDAHLSRNLTALADLRQTITFSGFMLPIPDPVNDLPEYQLLTDLPKLLILESMNFARQGNTVQAIDSLSVALKFTELLSLDANKLLITHKVAMSMQGMVLRWVHRLSVNYPLTQLQYSQLAELIDALPNYQNDGFAETFAGEFHFATLMFTQSPDGIFAPYSELASDSFGRFVDTLLEDGSFDSVSLKGALIGWLSLVSSSYHLHPNRTMTLLAELQSDLAAQASRYCHELNLSKSTGVGEINILDYVKPNGFVGEFIGDGDRYLRYFEERCLSFAHRQSVRLTVALQRYRARTGGYPDTLDMLVPEDLQAVPVDPFDGKPLKYLASSRWIYSSGTNFIDNQGSDRHFYDSRCRPDSECFQNPTFPIEPHPWYVPSRMSGECTPDTSEG